MVATIEAPIEGREGRGGETGSLELEEGLSARRTPWPQALPGDASVWTFVGMKAQWTWRWVDAAQPRCLAEGRVSGGAGGGRPGAEAPVQGTAASYCLTQ